MKLFDLAAHTTKEERRWLQMNAMRLVSDYGFTSYAHEPTAAELAAAEGHANTKPDYDTRGEEAHDYMAEAIHRRASEVARDTARIVGAVNCGKRKWITAMELLHITEAVEVMVQVRNEPAPMSHPDDLPADVMVQELNEPAPVSHPDDPPADVMVQELNEPAPVSHPDDPPADELEPDVLGVADKLDALIEEHYSVA